MGTIRTIRSIVKKHVGDLTKIPRKARAAAMQAAVAVEREKRPTQLASDGRCYAPYQRVPKGMRFQRGKLVPRA
jgi:hypothetical protein